MIVTHILLMFGGASAFFFWMRSFDSMVCYIAERRQELWITRGRPPGFLRIPTGADWWHGSRPRQRLIMEVLLYPPQWIREDGVLHRKWRRMFWLTVACWLVPVAMTVNALMHPLSTNV